jgi:hypothetical protein
MGIPNVQQEKAPYVPEAADLYYIGDCYERAEVYREWEIDG